MKRRIVACAVFTALTSAAVARISDDVVRIGVLTDLSSWGRDNSGPGSSRRRGWRSRNSDQLSSASRLRSLRRPSNESRRGHFYRPRVNFRQS